jgi:hypothetical protein
MASDDGLTNGELTATVLSALDDAARFWRDRVAACGCAARDERCPGCAAALADAAAYEHAYDVIAEDAPAPEPAPDVVRVRPGLL